ncbi:MAG: hypothetical protein VX777_01265 [Chlamydiota bacterium]|nr:hypothetical protein [Chlamydiota bacterium]
MSFKIFNESDSSISYVISPGKPNPKECRTEGCDTRSRVYQKGTSRSNCAFYAMNYIRERIGKTCSPSFEESRRIEALFSKRAKRIADINDLIRTVIIAMTNSEKYNLNSEGENLLNNLLDDYSWLIRGGKVSTNCLTAILFHRSFCIDVELLESLDVDIDLFEKVVEEMTNDTIRQIGPKLNFAETFKIKHLASHRIIVDLMTKLFNLTPFNWSPNDTIDDLIQELKEKGPAVFYGQLGAEFYKEAPFKLKSKKTIGEHAVYGWRPGQQISNPSAGHVVLAIGAEKIKDKGYVYYIDPNEESDPKYPQKKKVYISSYKGFCEKSVTSIGSEKSQCFDRKFAYLHGPSRETYTSNIIK